MKIPGGQPQMHSIRTVRLRPTPRTLATATLLAALLFVDGCHRHRKTVSAPNTTDYADNIEGVTKSPTLSILRWPNYSDYQPAVATFYDDRNNEVAWTRDGKPTKQALAFIQAFSDAAAKGLNPEDYDASLWGGRIQKLAGKNEDDFAQFDVAMTIAVMRYVSDLHIGRVNPTHFNFDIDVNTKKYDLAEFVSDQAVDADDVPKLVTSIEPNSEQYRKTEAALAHYLDLAEQQTQSNVAPLTVVAKPVSVGESFAEAGALLDRLKLEGDAPSDEIATTIYDKAISDSVKRYQHRHGITEDGKLTPQTVKSLNVPLSARVTQLQNSLERWRWLPDQYLNARIIVNLPEFVLHAYDAQHQPEFTMKVVVGKVVGEHQTPVFAHMMRYLVFRPYWSVPVDIAKKELVPHIVTNKDYLATKNFEVTNTKGDILTNYTAHQVSQGGVMVREKPGPKNSLGLVKFMFPNQYDVYLHSTPATELFNRTRRDFSHGCVRVQEPAKLAAWVLDGQKDRDNNDWDIDKVTETMNSGPDNHQVNLKTPIPIVIFYVTGFVEDDGDTHFFDDIYGYDAQLQAVLAKGMPYPVKREPVVAKTVPGDTL
ncbi:murein L,D-transpeptidase YcbB/YkuD [Granulicella aggregans]|uniref:Murein L,D-transpeptidase YcbB/YkuD n=1 Tax=Granulicella aggregans TaxID=474949 RepID=A0A7W8E5V5_9BACT|nr:L,D-transpeptidase family protein [Granulicella aggregans]MBB5058580.1 murein L,D-transpeptidase YcbB/YkuD [Granulicella aggregans]